MLLAYNWNPTPPNLNAHKHPQQSHATKRKTVKPYYPKNIHIFRQPHSIKAAEFPAIIRSAIQKLPC
jgi:hypothetical protein